MYDSWSDHVQYVGRTDVLFDILKTIGHAKNRLCERKLEIATRSLYTWVKLMSEPWRFVYIASHVTIHAKPDAQKVNLTNLFLCHWAELSRGLISKKMIMISSSDIRL